MRATTPTSPAVDHLVSELINEQITREEAAAQILQLSSSGHPTPRWAVTLSWAVTATGVALLLGGDWIVMLLAAVSGASHRGAPATARAAPAAVLLLPGRGRIPGHDPGRRRRRHPVPIDPSLVVTASIVMLLAGLGFIGAFQDALTGFYVTANARILEVMFATVGIIVGVSGGLALGRSIGVDVLVDPDLTAGFSSLPGVIIGSAITSAGFAFSAYSPARILAPIAVIGGLGGAIFFALTEAQVHPALAAGIAAFVIGFVSYPLAGRFRVPPLVIVVSSIVPLLPGPVDLHLADAARRGELHRHRRDDHRGGGGAAAQRRRHPRRVRRPAASARGPPPRASPLRAASRRADPHPARQTLASFLTDS